MPQQTENRISTSTLTLGVSVVACLITLIFQIHSVSLKFGSLITEVSNLKDGLSQLKQTVSDEAKKHEAHVLRFQEELLKLDGKVEALKTKIGVL